MIFRYPFQILIFCNSVKSAYFLAILKFLLEAMYQLSDFHQIF